MKIAVLIFSLFFLACGKPIPNLAPIDLAQWKEDKSGCNGVRYSLLEEMKNQKDELKGLSEKDIIGLLGRPDRNELYKRNQKFYYYDIEPGKKCAAASKATQQLIVRFNAMGMAKEVSIDSME